MQRRHILSLLLAGGISTAGCGSRRIHASSPARTTPFAAIEGSTLPIVHVDAARVIRTITGLRPYRASGFVVRAEELSGKRVVHNYGHGGGGMTLSWGSSHLAAQLAGDVAGKECAVIGGGVMGLTTARLLQLRGARVTVYTRDLPPNTTSNVAGAQWWPVSVFDNDRRTEQFSAQYVEAAHFSFRYFQDLVGNRWGVHWLPNYYLSESAPRNGWIGGPGGVLHDLQIAFRDFGPGEHCFPAAYVRRYTTMLIEPAIFLSTLLRDVQIAGGRLDLRRFENGAEVLRLPQSLIFNCTGIGARELFGDEELMPIKGQLSFLLPQAEIRYNLLSSAGYMFPRTDGILLGGTFEHNQWDLTPDPVVRDRMVEGHRTLFEQMSHLQQTMRNGKRHVS